MLLMIYSLFDVRVDVISANFALWNDWDKIGLNYSFGSIAQILGYYLRAFCANWWIVYFCGVFMTAYTAHLGVWNMFFDILVGYGVKIEIWVD